MKNATLQTNRAEWKKYNAPYVFIMLLSSFLLVNTVNAEEIDRDKAAVFAEQFIQQRMVQNKSTAQQKDSKPALILNKLYQSPDTAINTLHFFENEGGGFVIVLEQRGNFKVVGYSTKGKTDFNKIPDALKNLIASYEQISELASTDLLKSESIGQAVEPLLDKKGINLNQYHHENAGNCPSGCVATAFAQIMSYYKYPESGVGSNCYTSNYGEICANFATTNYNWNNPTHDDYKLLSQHVGVAMNMKYCGDASGSIPAVTNYWNVMQKNFKYHMHFGSSESFYIKNELDNERPVYIELPGNPSHALVADGYDQEGYFHLNFGWGGFSNGYFLLNIGGTLNVGYTFGTNVTLAVYISPKPYKTNVQDSLALVTFHNKMNGKTGWDLSKPVINWPGVVVMNERVIRLKSTSVFEGTIPPEIGNLTALQNLSIRGPFSGSFPMEITQLTNLKELTINKDYFADTTFSSFPAEIGNLVNLEILRLPVKGTIPKSIGKLSKLKSLDLSRGKLTGGIPEELYSLTNLEELVLYMNQLSGPISGKIGQLTKLKKVQLYKNQFSGKLPEEIGNLTDLRTFDVFDNKFSGVIPESIGNWVKLESISLNNNSFEGKLPDAIGNFTNFTILRIDNNKFSALPGTIGNLQNLKEIIASNNLIDSIPSTISKLDKLFRLEMSNNRVKTIPDLGTMPALWDINLADNQISVLPESFGKLKKVKTLNLSNNLITTLPSTFENLTTINELYLNNNKLTNLPFAISLLSNLKMLIIQNNQLSGPLPPMKHIGLLDLWIQGNKLTFSDIAASGMPDDLNYVDRYTFLYDNQQKVEVKDSVYWFADGDEVSIDIRKISRLSHPMNVYEWFKNDVPFQSGPVLKLTRFEKTHVGSYYCRVTNPDYRSFLVLQTKSFQLKSNEELILQKSFQTTSRATAIREYSDHQLKLKTPDEIRGTCEWQASVDSVNWINVAQNMNHAAVKQNVVSIDPNGLQIEPKSPMYFRYVLKEGNCDPITSDVIKIKPYGALLLDTVIHVQNKDITVSKDSIEIVFPANFTDKPFRLTIEKLYNPPAAPDSAKLGSVYDVNVSCGSVFDIPLLIRFKNIDKKKIVDKDIDKYKAVYFDDREQKWVMYENRGISLKDTALEFYTSHLTKLGWFEFAHGSFTHIHTGEYVNIIYKWGSGGDYVPFQIYENDLKNLPGEYWHNSNTDPDNGGTPLMIQDMCAFMDQIIRKFKSLNLQTPSLRFNVYVDSSIKAAGQIGLFGYTAGRGYFYVNPYYNMDPEVLRTTLAHEYMHYTQDYYMTTTVSNYWWMEANAPLSDRLVWDETTHKVAEPELLLKNALVPSSETKTIFEILSQSWYDSYNIPVLSKFINSLNPNLAGTFLHFMRSYRDGEKLQPALLLKETSWFETWIQYLDGYIKKYLNSNIGDEYDAFVKYIIEGSNDNFTVLNKKDDEDPLKYFKSSPEFVTDKIYKFNNEKTIKDSVQLEVPYLASKMVQMYNANANQRLIIRYKRKNPANENLKAYICKYDSDNKQMTFEEISEKDSSAFFIDKAGPDVLKRKHVAFLLFINKGTEENIDVNYELTLYNIPEFKMMDSFTFSSGDYGTTNLKIHSITDGTNEKLDEFYLIPVVYRQYADKYYSPITFSSDLNDSIYSTRAISDWFEQTITYNYITGDMTIYNRENWGGIEPTSRLDMREITMVLKNIWLSPGAGNFYAFSTKSTAETQNAIQSISYTRKYTSYDASKIDPVTNPLITYTYLRTNYPANSTQYNYVKFSLVFHAGD